MAISNFLIYCFPFVAGFGFAYYQNYILTQKLVNEITELETKFKFANGNKILLNMQEEKINNYMDFDKFYNDYYNNYPSGKLE